MPQGPDGNTIIIVKKVVGHGGAHGGAWKVAYADFVTSMMALFMVLWLVNTASVVTRERIASYFKQPGIFEKGSGTPLEIGESGLLKESFTPPVSGNSQVTIDKSIYSIESNKGLRTEGVSGGEINNLNKPINAQEQAELNNIQKEEFERVAEEIKENLGGEGDKTETGTLGEFSVQVDEIGLHLEIMDTQNASMFALGSNVILGDAQQKLKEIAEMLKQLPNPVEIEGHTDARPFKNGGADGLDNWILSTSRANAARRVLEQAGVNEKQILSVIGYADRKLKIPDNPFADSNRRISISMRYSNQAAQALKNRSGVSRRDLKKEKAEILPKVEQVIPKEENKSSANIETSSSSSAPAIVIEAEEFKDFENKSSSASSVSSVPQRANEVSSTKEEVKPTEKKDQTESKVNRESVPEQKKVEKLPIDSKEENAAAIKIIESKNIIEIPKFSLPTPAVTSDPKKPIWQQKEFIFGDNNPFNK